MAYPGEPLRYIATLPRIVSRGTRAAYVVVFLLIFLWGAFGASLVLQGVVSLQGAVVGAIAFTLMFGFIGAVVLRFLVTRGFSGASTIRVDPSGFTLTFPDRKPWTVLWTNPRSGFRILRVVRTNQSPPVVLAVLTGAWKPDTPLVAEEANWLLQEAARHGWAVTPSLVRRDSISYVEVVRAGR